MNILVDIGNTDTKYINSDDVDVSEIKRIANDSFNAEWLTANWLTATNIVLASVSDNQRSEIIASWALNNNIPVTHVKTEAQAFGVTCGYENYKQLGVDRWLAILGTKKLYPKINSLVIDAGTATTVDLIDSEANHQGGWILPGIDMMFASVLEKTANVRAQKNDYADISFARNTSDNVNHACWAATIGMVEVAIKEAEEQGYIIEQILFTGGYGESLSTLLKRPSMHIPQLVFYGLKMYL